MSCVRSAFLLALATAAAGGAAAAEESMITSPNVKQERPAILSPLTDTPSMPPTSARPRAVSPAAAAQLASVTPKYESIVPVKPAEPLPDLRETDKPKNTIIRLPPYLVPESKPPPVLKERELLTPKARLELALKKYPGLRLGSFWIFNNDGIALAMLAEQERLDKKHEFEELADLMRFSDPAMADKAKREVDRAFLRPADFGR